MVHPEDFKKLKPAKRMPNFDYREDFFPKNQFDMAKHADD